MERAILPERRAVKGRSQRSRLPRARHFVDVISFAISFHGTKIGVSQEASGADLTGIQCQEARGMVLSSPIHVSSIVGVWQCSRQEYVAIAHIYGASKESCCL